MKILSRLEQSTMLDRLVKPGQELARLIPPGKVRDALHGVWLGHPAHPALVQVPTGAWLSASVVGLRADQEPVARALTAIGLAGAVPAVLTGLADWSEQHEQQMRVGVVHALANATAITCYATSLATARPAVSRALRLAGLAAVSAGGFLGGHLAFRLAGGANHAEAVPHLIEPGWHGLMPESDLRQGALVRAMLGEVPVAAIRRGGQVHVLADRCSHLSGSLAEGELSGDQVTCPWHGSAFCLRDGSVVRGPATAPQPSFETRIVDGVVEVRLPGAG
ncbi:MAG TPA: Rieske 2Fe-2S domain-containing protein [Streptosporangiaceae bacterium]|jgi:nitrite reductase/ring-hydroxylating ferredoxin subunit